MASVLKTEVENPDYINFLKVGLSLKELQKGLGPFIENQLQTIHGSIISRFGGSNCGKCTSSNVLLHAKCSKKGCVCRKQPAARRRCPSQNCVIFYDEMVKQHRFGDPQLLNSDVSFWFSDPWEFGKCFMLPHSSDNKTSPIQCDASALLTLIINCIPFEKVVGVTIQTPPKTPKDVFSEVREIRNSTMHSETFAVSEADMELALDKIVSALQSGLLQHDADAIRAASEVQKLKDKTFVVTRPLEKEVLEDKLNAIEELLSRKTTDIKCNIDQLVDTMAEIKEKLQDEEHERKNQIDDCKKELEKQSQEHERDFKRLDETIGEIKAELPEIDTRLTTEIREVNEQIVEHRKVVKHQGQHHASDFTKLTETMEKTKAKLPKIDARLTKEVQACKEQIVYCRQEVKTQGQQHDSDFKKIPDTTPVFRNRLDTMDTERKLLQQADELGYGAEDQTDKLEQMRQIKSEQEAAIHELQENDQHNAAHDAAMTGDIDGLKTLLDQGIDPMYRTSTQKTLLHIAARYKHRGIVDFLCKSYSYILHMTDSNEWDAAHYASMAGDIDCLKTLLDQGIYPMSRTSTQETLLHIAARYKHRGIVDFLCKSYPYILHMTDTDEWNAAHYAAMGGDIECLKTLIDYGIDPQSMAYTNPIPFHVAQRYKHRGIDDFPCKSYPYITYMTDSNEWNAAHYAAMGGDFECLQTLVEQGIDPLSRTYTKETLLHIATRYKHRGIVDFLCKSYPEILHMTYSNGWNAAHYAAMGGDFECLQTLLEHGIDPRSRTYTKETLLHIAARYKHRGIVDFLCKSYPYILHMTGTNHCNAAHFAAMGGDIDCLKALVEHGIDPLSTTCTQETMLHVAVCCKHHGFVDFLCKSFPKILDMTASNQWNAAHYAAIGGHIGCLKTLIDKGIEPISRTSTQKTLLHVAARYKHPGIVDFLCKSYPNILDMTDINQMNAAHNAVICGDMKCLKTLIEHGIDPMARNSTQVTLLHVAARYKHRGIVDFLCKSYLEILHMTDSSQVNAAHYAAICGDKKCLKILIEHGIDPMARTSTQKTLLHLAARYEHRGIVDFLCKSYPEILHMTDSNQVNAAHYAAIGGDIKCLQTLIEHGIDPMARTSTQETLLHLAVRYGHRLIFNFLLKSYPSMLHMTSTDEWNAAHYAAMGGDIYCLETLIGHDIDPMARTSTQETLLHVAARYKHRLIFDFLRKSYPAMLHMTSNDEWNAAHYAAMGGDIYCLKTLIEHGIDPMARTSTQETLLHLAARYKHRLMFNFLRKSYPAMLHMTSTDEWNAAHYAAMGGDIYCLKTLIELGIDPMARTSAQETLLHVAARYKHPGIVEYLRETYIAMAGGTVYEETMKTQMAEGESSNKQTIFGKPFEYSCVLDDQNTTFEIPGSDVQVKFPTSLTKNNGIEVHGSTFRSIFHIRKRFDLPASEALASPVTEYHVTGCTTFLDYACVKMPFVGPRSELKVWKFPSDDDITNTTTRIQVPLKGSNSNEYLPDMFYEVEGSSTCLVYTRSFSCFYCTTDGRRPLKLMAISYASHKRFRSTGSRPQHEVRIRMYIADEVMKFQDYKQRMDDIEKMQDRSQADGKVLSLPGTMTSESIIEACVTPTEDSDNQWVHKPFPNSNEPIFPKKQTLPLTDVVLQCPNCPQSHLQTDELPYSLEWYLTTIQDNTPSLSFQGLVTVYCVDNQQKRSTILIIDMRQEGPVPAEETPRYYRRTEESGGLCHAKVSLLRRIVDAVFRRRPINRSVVAGKESTPAGIESEEKRQNVTEGAKMKKLGDDTMDQYLVTSLKEHMHSVGALVHGDRGHGTVFRVGSKYVMTAKHVVSDIIDPGRTGREDANLLKGNDVHVTFSGSLYQPGPLTYKIKEITYDNRALDVAILEIDNYRTTAFPSSMVLCKCPLDREVTEISLIGFGHPSSFKKQLDPRCRIKYQDDVYPAIDYLRTNRQMYKGQVRGYQGNTPHMVSSVDQLYNNFNNQDKLLWSCYMENGGSGSPVINHIDHKSLKVVALYTHAIPGFLQYLDPVYKRHYPCDKRFEMGPRMSSIFLDLQQRNIQLANELFPGDC